MPYKDLEKEKQSLKERKKRYLERKHIEKYGIGAGDFRGRHGHHPRGSKCHLWNPEKLFTRDGYVLIRVGITHPLADPNGYAREHLLVWVSAGNPHLDPHELIHHKDGDRTNNRIENLELKSKEDHNTLHNNMRGRDDKGHFLPKSAGRLLDGREYLEVPNGIR